MNYFKTVFKFLRRNKFFTSINILGLSVALAVSFIMILYVINELSYDSIHKNKKNIYRVVNFYKEFDTKLSSTPFPLAKDLKASFPQIEKSTNCCKVRKFMIKLNDEWVKQRAIASTSDVFDIFTIPLQLQTKKQQDLLKNENDIVISEKMAKMLFKEENPLNKQINVLLSGEEKLFNVVAVYKDFPKNSSLQANCFVNSKLPLDNINKVFGVDNSNTTYQLDLWTTWIKTSKNTEISSLTQGLKKFLQSHDINSKKKKYSFQSLNDFHLHSSDIENSGQIGNMNHVKFISIIVLLILVIATLNYIILSTATSNNRAKEIGIRKTIGAAIGNIRIQLLSESVFVAFLSIPFALLLMYILIPYAENLFEQQLLIIDNNAIFYVSVLIVVPILIGLISGIYNTLYLSKLKTIDILQKKQFIGKQKTGFRSVLIVTQLVIFCVFVASSFIIRSQYKYALHKELGFETNNRIFVDVDKRGVDYQLFLENINAIPEVISAGASMDALPIVDESSFMLNHFIDTDKKIKVEALDVDFNFLETMEIKLKEGRYFSEEFRGDMENSIIINEEAAKQLGIENPIGKKIIERTIIGVTNNFIFHSIHSSPPPLVMVLTDKYISQIAIHYRKEQQTSLLSKLNKEWTKLYKDVPFTYCSSEDIKKEIYVDEQNFMEIIVISGIFTLVIAMLGLFGITLFVTKSRTKEIGIRKVVGSSSRAIVVLFLKANIRNVIIASLISAPISYFIMKEWLQTYAFSTEINILHFVLSAIIAFIVVVITVIGQAYIVASRNPVEALRYE